MNKEYMAIAAYHVVIKYQFGALIDALESLAEFNPKIYEAAAHMKELDSELEEEGRRLLERIEKEYEEKDKKD